MLVLIHLVDFLESTESTQTTLLGLRHVKWQLRCKRWCGASIRRPHLETGQHSTGLSIALNKSVASKTMTFVSVTSGGSGSLGETYVNTPFMKKVLHITERKRETDIQHYCKSDDVWTGFKVAKRRLFCHSKMLQSSPARFKLV